QALRVVIFLHRFSLPWKRSISDILSRQVNGMNLAMPNMRIAFWIWAYAGITAMELGLNKRR
ncbi:MAG: hypothetical protein ABW068_14375, partial [Candidatus Thiodiazotropha sp.]